MSRRTAAAPPPPNAPPRRTSNAKARRWCFTENDQYTVDVMHVNFQTEGLPEGIRYIVFQKEVGENTRHPHLQGYVELSSPQRLSWLKRHISETAHFEVSRGKPDTARDYCMKEDTRVDGPWEFGEFKGNQGKRTDLDDVADKLKAGTSMQIIIQEHAVSYIRYHRGIELLSKKLNPPVNIPTYNADDFAYDLIRPDRLRKKAIVLYGKTNTGKTSYALAHFKRPLLIRHMDALTYFNADIHDGIVFDDMSFRHMPIGARIHLTDMDLPSDIHVRYTFVCIPAGTPRIFTYNNKDIFFSDAADEEDPDQKDAIRRRVKFIEVKENLYCDYTDLGSDIDDSE